MDDGGKAELFGCVNVSDLLMCRVGIFDSDSRQVVFTYVRTYSLCSQETTMYASLTSRIWSTTGLRKRIASSNSEIMQQFVAFLILTVDFLAFFSESIHHSAEQLPTVLPKLESVMLKTDCIRWKQLYKNVIVPGAREFCDTKKY